MALVSCPDCGAQVSDSAIVCAQCGFPLRREALARAGAGGGSSSSTNTVAIIVGVAVAGVVVVVFVGILAALAIPRFAMATQRAKEMEGVGLLKQAYVLENTYYANNGAYASTFTELESVGWEEPDSTRYYTLEIGVGQAPGDLCVEARPKRGADVQPLSIDSAGVIYHDEGCSGETISQSRASAFDRPAPDPVPGEDGDAGARTLLREVWLGVAEYRTEHGSDPTELGQVLRHVHFSRASNENTLTVHARRGGVCVSAVPTAPEPGRHELSVDGAGRLYHGTTCSGAAVEQFMVEPAGAGSSQPGDKTPS